MLDKVIPIDYIRDMANELVVTLRLPEEMVADIDLMCEAELRSRGRMIQMLLSEAIDRRQNEATGIKS